MAIDDDDPEWAALERVRDALRAYLISLGFSADPAGPTGNQELDDLIAATL